MELVHGDELFEKIFSSHHLSERSSVIIMEQILNTINYLHNKRIVHKDIKHEKILYDGERIKLIDFGSAKRFNPKRKMKALNGTLFYIAPEVLNGSYDERCDVWSCEILMCILLTGRPPFNGKDVKQIFETIKKEKLNLNHEEFKYVSDNA